MSAPIELLHGVGLHALPVLAGTAVAAAEVGSTVLAKVWEWWTKKTKEAERRRELETLANMTGQQVKEAVRELADKLAGDHPPAVRSKLEGYLLAVPAQIRRTLRRPSDASGLTVPPDLGLSRVEDLAPLLPPRPPRFSPGDKAPGTDFELVELLGIGGFGEVWKAKNAYMPGAPLVALKFCLDPESAASLRRETALLDRIQREGKHPGIVELRHTFLSSEPPFLEYELVEGGDLGGLILDWHRTKGGPTPAQAARVVHRLADVVAFAHARGIVHRDLKPANILLGNEEGRRMKDESKSGTDSTVPSSFIPQPSSFRLKVADFGIGGIASEAAARQARLTLAASTLTAAAAHGSYSLYYASPEQMRGAAPDPRDDVHALGVIWYQLLLGDLTAEAPRGAGWKKRLAAKGMPVDLVELLECCVASEREDRPADAKEVAGRLAFALADPSPGLDIDFDLMAPAELKSPAPARLERAAPLAPPPVTGIDLSHLAPTDAMKASRLVDFVDQLRAVRTAHDRVRWSGGWVCWVVPLAIVVGLGVAAGAIAASELDQAHGENVGIGKRIAAQHSTPTRLIEFHSSPYPVFRLSTTSGRDVHNNSSYAYATGGNAASPTVEPWTTGQPTPEQREKAEKYAHEANAALAEAILDYNAARVGGNGVWWGLLAGVPTSAALLVAFLLVRRWRVRKLRETLPVLTAETEAEYPRELRTLPEPLNLNHRNALNNFIVGLERTGLAPTWLLPTPAYLFHRAFAPF